MAPIQMEMAAGTKMVALCFVPCSFVSLWNVVIILCRLIRRIVHFGSSCPLGGARKTRLFPLDEQVEHVTLFSSGGGPWFLFVGCETPEWG